MAGRSSNVQQRASATGFVIRSAHSRSIRVGHEPGGARALLHVYARTLPEQGHCEVAVAQQVVIKKPKRQGQKTTAVRTKRLAPLSVAAAPVLLHAPSSKTGEHGDQPLAVWIVRVGEANPPPGEEPLEWLLLTNHPVTTAEAALLVKTWYEWRWTIEELHKAICLEWKWAGCGIESLCFQHVDRLRPAIGILSILALTLLALRDPGRNPQARTRLAREQIDDEDIEVLSLWRHRTSRPDWTQHEFYLALGRLGGHSGRPSSPPPGWLVLWRGWEKLQLMTDGARIAKLRHQRELNQYQNKCA